MKGITSIIAVVLLLLITIAIAGFVFLFLLRATESSTSGAQQQLETHTQSIQSSFIIEGVSQNHVYIRNTGNTPLTNVGLYVNNIPVSFNGPSSLAADEIGVYDINNTDLIAIPNPSFVKVTSSGWEQQLGATPVPSIPPIISGVNISLINSTSSIITWTTDIQSTSAVNYGTSPGSYTNTQTGSDGTSHSVTLTGLTQLGTYFFVVRSSDSLGNTAQSPEYSFIATCITPPPTSAYSYTTIPSNFTNITLGINTTIRSDDSYVTVPIGFNFTFYQNTYTSVNVSTNGYLAFSQSASSPGNSDIPTAGAPNNYIAPFWDDLDPRIGGDILYNLSGTAPNRTFIIQWQNIPPYGLSDGLTFQAKLYESSNNIEFQYLDVNSGFSVNGTSATAGLESADGTNGTKFSYNTPSLYNGLGILFQPAAPPPTCASPPEVSIFFVSPTPSTGQTVSNPLIINMSLNPNSDTYNFTLLIDNERYLLPDLLSCRFENIVGSMINCDNGKNGTMSTPDIRPGKFGQGIEVNYTGSQNPLTFPSTGNINNTESTVMFWIKLNGTWTSPNSYTLIDTTNNTHSPPNRFGFNVTAIPLSNSLELRVATDAQLADYSSSASLSYGPFNNTNWTHVAIGIGSTSSIFVNGYPIFGSLSTPGSIRALNSEIYLGSNRTGGRKANAIFDNFKIYRYKLDSKQIVNIYNNESLGREYGSYYLKLNLTLGNHTISAVTTRISNNTTLGSETRTFTVI